MFWKRVKWKYAISFGRKQNILLDHKRNRQKGRTGSQWIQLRISMVWISILFPPWVSSCGRSVISMAVLVSLCSLTPPKGWRNHLKRILAGISCPSTFFFLLDEWSLESILLCPISNPVVVEDPTWTPPWGPWPGPELSVMRWLNLSDLGVSTVGLGISKNFETAFPLSWDLASQSAHSFVILVNEFTTQESIMSDIFFNSSSTKHALRLI